MADHVKNFNTDYDKILSLLVKGKTLSFDDFYKF